MNKLPQIIIPKYREMETILTPKADKSELSDKLDNIKEHVISPSTKEQIFTNIKSPDSSEGN